MLLVLAKSYKGISQVLTDVYFYRPHFLIGKGSDLLLGKSKRTKR